MHRSFALLLTAAPIACAWANDAFAQDAAVYGVTDDRGAPYDDGDTTQPLDELDAESEEPVDPEMGSIDTFHGALAPYGNWIRSAEYGLIWVPSRALIGASFVPYSSRGSWRYTTAGWMFASDWDRGWAAYH
jgi:hypothetical protein